MRAAVYCMAGLLLCTLLKGTAVANAIQISASSDLSFGRFAAISAGMVTLSPAGLRSSTGGIALLTCPVSAAEFTLTGDANLNYAIVLPASAVLSNGTSTLTIDTFVSNPEGTGVFSTSGVATLQVGARLVVGTGISEGAYLGNFDIIVNYN